MTVRILLHTGSTGNHASCGAACAVLLTLFTSYALADAELDSEAAPLSGASMLQPAVLELSGAVIGDIRIANNDIFDLQDPAENRFLYRLANDLHIETRKDVIRQQLLFEPGEPFSSHELLETERILRANHYIHEATIKPVHVENGVVDVEVDTTDTWTLTPRLSASRAGGENTTGIGLRELNLLGTGVEVEALYKSNVDRDAKIFRLIDHHLGDSWYSFTGTYSSNSDGNSTYLDIGKPFYALDSKSANGISFFDNDEIQNVYDYGNITASFRHQTSTYEIFKGWSAGLQDGWVRRYKIGLGHDEHLFSDIDAGDGVLDPSALQDRLFVYPFFDFELLQDHFEKTHNVDQVSKTEDRFLGTRLSGRLGYASTGLGSYRNAWLLGLDAQKGFGSSDSTSLVLASTFGTRIEDGDLHNLSLEFSARYHRRQSDHRLLYASLSGLYGYNLDVDNLVQLGGDTGLRGYPLRYQGGDKRALLTVEQRYFTDWYPFRLFRVGGAVFFDMGRTWGGTGIDYRNQEWQKDIGFGLRIGSTRSGSGRMTHIDLAYPLDGSKDISNVQLVIETKTSF